MKQSSFGFDVPEDSLGFLLWQVTTVWQRLIKKALEQYNISHAQFVIMALLLWSKEQSIEVTQVELVRMSKLDKMTISKSLKKLVELKFVKRLENLNDTRAKTVLLTHSGGIFIKKLIPIVENIDNNVFNEITKKEQTYLIKILQNLKEKISDFE